MVGLCVDVLWVVVWLSVRTVGTVCKVEDDVQVVNNFHVCLYGYVKSMSLEASCYFEGDHFLFLDIWHHRRSSTVHR